MVLANDALNLFGGRVAVVTGASRGIGRAIALALARSGARVHAVARDSSALEAVASENPNIVVQAADIADPTSIENLVTRLSGTAPSVSILVHSAGTLSHAPTRSAEMVDFDEMLDVNLRGAYRLTQRLLPQLIENTGDIAFVNSSATHFPRAMSGQYAATQHALVGFANSLREEVNELGVRVLSVYPGKTATRLQERLHREAGEAYRSEFMLQPEDVAQVLVGALGLPRRAEVTEIRIRPTRKK